MPTIWKTLFDPDFHPALQPRKYYPVRNNLPEVTVTNVNLPEVNINPKYLLLRTWRPMIDNNFIYTGHSKLSLGNSDQNNPLYIDVNKKSNDPNYNLLFNNCSDATKRVLEKFYSDKINPFLFTTPGDVRDYFKDKTNLEEDKYNQIILPLNNIEFERLYKIMVEENSKSSKNPERYINQELNRLTEYQIKNDQFNYNK